MENLERTMIEDPTTLPDYGWACLGEIAHDEIMGCDENGNVIVWDNGIRHPVLSGQTVDEARSQKISFIESDRIERDVFRFQILEASPAPSPGFQI